uniref:Uncharacterized protein n=1 Tax=Arundo donax TaxID=35708 RepID=A0A0A8ZSP6_ARUDO
MHFISSCIHVLWLQLCAFALSKS